MPGKSSVPMLWRLKKSKYRLVGTKCLTCNSLYFPPRPLCPDCRSKSKMEDFQFSGKGVIESFTVIRVPPEGFETYTPFAVGMIRLEEGPTIEGQIVGNVNKVEMGKNVRPVFRKFNEDGSTGLIHYGIKFELEE
jgi:uncharacterized OB-fold protein